MLTGRLRRRAEPRNVDKPLHGAAAQPNLKLRDMSLLAHSTLYGNEHTLKQSRMMIMGPKKGREVVTGLRTYRCCLLDSDSHVCVAEVIACSTTRRQSGEHSKLSRESPLAEESKFGNLIAACTVICVTPCFHPLAATR